MILNKFFHWLVWKVIVRRMAKAHGFLDPFTIMGKLRGFAQPSEVAEPGELLRAGVVFHARGLMNRAIQYNDDWVWPYWAERQFDPRDKAFVPRAFSLTHINLTHRNWTAVGVPNFTELPLVDPAGLVTPFLDGWSLDAIIQKDDGERLIPSRMADNIHQQMDIEDRVAITTQADDRGMRLEAHTDVHTSSGEPVCRVHYKARSHQDGWLAVGIRPYNPEGVHLVYNIKLDLEKQIWSIDSDDHVALGCRPDKHLVSDYRSGDILNQLPDKADGMEMEDDVGMATAAALYRLKAGEEREIEVSVPLMHKVHFEKKPEPVTIPVHEAWEQALENKCNLETPDEKFQFLYDAAIRTMILHAPDENVYPGPFIYKRFWFRDAALILNSMLCAGISERAERVIDSFPKRQRITGYYESQEGEWDSNGEALWAMGRFCELMGRKPKDKWKSSMTKAAKWICDKRMDKDKKDKPGGLFPAGFSAEHLGLNDYYYWDDFWGVAGLRAAADMCRHYGDSDSAEKFSTEADDFMNSIEEYLEKDAQRLNSPAMPAAPNRRLDGGSIGSVVVGFPLGMWQMNDERPHATVEALMERYSHDGAFFHQMGHSGYNAYLTLHMAQNLLRYGDGRYIDLVRAVARLASPTGQWPEAIHPATLGGCMGDGQHVWAAAEWVLMMRSLFVMEDLPSKRLVLGAGILPEWVESGAPVSFGPTQTPWGPIRVWLDREGDTPELRWEGEWRDEEPEIEVRMPSMANA
ncbi:MAG: hypothetical protein ACLFUS_08060 [Candidatus Sumerlaeia bacterium]